MAIATLLVKHLCQSLLKSNWLQLASESVEGLCLYLGVDSIGALRAICILHCGVVVAIVLEGLVGVYPFAMQASHR